ncbi:ATP-binding protein [Schaedlerella arabinosiphila]|uniref:ATP-binding protein n=1 Tax=Schaedlerella arabinosiphila TaxID=2044587 RepID=A0A426DD78_9FIRM|nr:ATP-binding protein [Schaedlerella arabinosiphila]RRK30809.1 ATP-binding protein [Schaedlerella arabinosiphila]
MIKRDYYLNRMIHHMWNGEVKVITGIRRCGKSVLLFDLFYEYLLSQEVQEDHIIKIELDQRRYYKFRNPITLCEYVENLVSGKKDGKFYLFIDEVQLTTKVIDKENGDIEVSIYDMLNELKAYKNLDVYVTGSNSKGLSKDIATEFRGRATQIHVFPLSFEEFYSHVGGDERKALDTYMLYGGMPRLLALTDEKDKKDYLSSLCSELYVKDIVERNGIEREDILNDILDFLASQISSLTNPTNIANALTSIKNEKVNSTLVSNYVQHIIDSFLISMAKRYDIKGKTYFKYPNKYYYTDIGLRNARLNYRQYDPGHIMENIIYNELLRRGYSVDVGVVTDRTGGANVQKEIDFVVNDADKKIYIQSAFQMDTDKKESSELASLILTKDFFKKVIVRMDIPHNFYDDNGIFHCNLIDLLLGRVELF